VDGATTIVSVGGDGTLNEITNGFLDGTGRPWNPEAALAVFPLGTGSDFVKTSGHSRDPAELVRILKQREICAIDAGLVEFAEAGTPRSRYFLNEGEFGSAAAVSDRVNRTTKVFGGKISFLIGVLRTLPRYRNTRVVLEVDGGPPREMIVNSVTAANGRFYGGGLQPAPHASLDDGLFDVIVFGDIDFKHQRKNLGLLREGKHLDLPGVSWFRAKEVRIRAGNEMIDVEGEYIGRHPQRFEILPRAVRLVDAKKGR
jgi:YegS/Rv2252/BmrU family lipid kinase